MLKFNCHCCKKKIEQPSALLFSPPKRLNEENEDSIYLDDVKKYHICPDCFDDIIGFMMVDLD